MTTSRELDKSNYNTLDTWKEQWREAYSWGSPSMVCISGKPPAVNEPRKLSSVINRYRTGHGKCIYSLYKWGNAPTSISTMELNVKPTAT